MSVESGPFPPSTCLLSPGSLWNHNWASAVTRFATSPRAKSFARHISIPMISTGWSPGGFLLPQMAVGGNQLAQKKIAGDSWWLWMCTWDPSRRGLRYLGSLLEGMFQVAGWCSLGVLLGDPGFRAGWFVFCLLRSPHVIINSKTAPLQTTPIQCVSLIFSSTTWLW